MLLGYTATLLSFFPTVFTTLALIGTQMPSYNWVEDNRVGDTKSPILFTAYGLD